MKNYKINICRFSGLGDTILITKCDVSERPAKLVTHIVDRVVFKYGNIIDPVTKKRVIKEKYEDDISLQTKLVKEIIEEPSSHASVFRFFLP